MTLSGLPSIFAETVPLRPGKHIKDGVKLDVHAYMEAVTGIGLNSTGQHQDIG